MNRDFVFRMTRRCLVVLVVALVCLTGCTAFKHEPASTGRPGQTATCDLRVNKAVRCLTTRQLSPRMVRVYWAGETSFAVDGRVQLTSRQALVRYLSHLGSSRLQHGVLLVSARPGPGFDPLDTLSAFCLKHNVNLYCVALTNADPAEPAVQDEPSAGSDWRADLPSEVYWVVQAGGSQTTGATHLAASNQQPAGPIAAR